MASSIHLTSGIYRQVLETLLKDIRKIKGETKAEVREEFNRCVHSAVNSLELLAQKNPLELPLNLDSANNWCEILDTIKAKALENEKNGRIANNIVYGNYYKDNIANNIFISPVSINGNDVYRKDGNIVIYYERENLQYAIERLNNIVFSLLLSLPPKKVNLSVVDFGMDGAAGFLTRGLDPGIYHDEVIVAQEAYMELLNRLQILMAQRIKRYGDMMEQNEKSGEIKESIEIVLLMGDPDRFDYHWDVLKPIWENGRKGGVIFILMKDNAIVPPREDVKPALNGLNFIEVSSARLQYEVNYDHTVRLTPVAQVEELAHLCFDYLNDGFRAKEIAKKIMDTVQIDSDYEDCSDGILEVGIGKGERAEAQFRMDLVDHIHAFILGMSGSGKSVLLHNIIANLIGKYSPEQLQLYLLDFKLGGVEFNRYRNTKHVKALLVDNSDNSVVLEILRELNTSMYERGKLLKAANVQRIDEYNRLNPEKPMPQILTVIDECHNAFKLEGDRLTALQREVFNILIKIAKEGRNQGVHLIMATQTLNGADIPGEILNNISEHYLLKCAQADSDRLAPNSSSITFCLPTGKVFYHHQSGTQLFQGYYVGDDALEKKVNAANEKALAHTSNGQFYFSGSQIYTLNNEVADRVQSISKCLTITPGETCSLRHQPISIQLPKEDAQNILITGIDPSTTMRTTLATIASTIMWNERKDVKYRIAVINCLEQNDQLLKWQREGKISLYTTTDERAELLGTLVNAIQHEKAEPTILAIIGQQLFRELKKDRPISIMVKDKPVETNNIMDMGNSMTIDVRDIPIEASEPEELQESDDFGFSSADGDFEQPVEETATNNMPETIPNIPQGFKFESSFAKALPIILKSGSEQDVHVIMQINKPGKYLFDDYPSKNLIYNSFAHLLLHRCDESTISTLNLRDTIHPENLTSDEDRLKAIYYNEQNDSCQTFSPYILN